MPALDYDAFRESVKKGEILPAYYFHGDEDLLKDDALRQVLEAAVDSSSRDFNLDRRRAADLSADDFWSLALTPPMLAERPELREPRFLVGVAGAVLVLAVVGAVGWEAHTWIAPAGSGASSLSRGPDRGADPFVRLAGERPGDYRSRFSVIPVSRDSSHRAARPDQPVELTVDWMAP